MQVVLISGLSGSGKSIALTVLEDAGYYVVDNLPALFLPQICGFLKQAGYLRAAISIDVRSGNTVNQLPEQLKGLQADGIDVRLLFLDAKTDTLIKRFSETRRRHPLSDGRLTVPECVARERQLLDAISSLGHRIDTSDLRPQTLRHWVKDVVALDPSRLSVICQSFGFKHGVPLDADFVFDVRCLPNPHYDPVLRPLTGRDQAVIDYLVADDDVDAMFTDIHDFIQRWLPSFERDNRSYVTLAIGCTGGQHRSVYLVERMAQVLRPDWNVLLRHRELAG